MDGAAPTFGDPRQPHTQFTLGQRRRCVARIDGARDAHGAHEAAEAPLGQMKRRFAVGARRRQLAPCHYECPMCEDHPQIAGPDTGKVHPDFDGACDLQHIHGRRAVSGDIGGGGIGEQISEPDLLLFHLCMRHAIAKLTGTLRHGRRIVARARPAGT